MEESNDEILSDVEMPLSTSPGLPNEMERSPFSPACLDNLEMERSMTSITAPPSALTLIAKRPYQEGLGEELMMED